MSSNSDTFMWFLNLVRWKNLLIIMVMQGLVLYFICDEPDFLDDGEWITFFGASPILLILIWLATISIAAAGNIINDVYDRKIDSINKPGKNVIGAEISFRNSILLVLGLNVAGIILGFLHHI